MKPNTQSRELGNLWRHTRPQHAKTRCFNASCEGRTSKNHLLMKNGILNEISGQSRHVRELRTNRFRAPQQNYYSFERVGCDDALTKYGYCPKCDHDLFSPIESPSVQIPTTIEGAFRYGLRPVLHEIRKKQANLKFLPKLPILERQRLFPGSTAKPEEVERFGITVLRKIYDALDIGIRENYRLDYCVIRTDRQEVCASSVLMRPKPIFALRKEELFEGNFGLDVVSFNVINIFPANDELVIISIANPLDLDSMAFNRKLADCSKSELNLMLSDLLIGQIEDWAVSESLFSGFPPGLDKLISCAKHNNAQFYTHHGIDLFTNN